METTAEQKMNNQNFNPLVSAMGSSAIRGELLPVSTLTGGLNFWRFNG